jgi:hypothetical protein
MNSSSTMSYGEITEAANVKFGSGELSGIFIKDTCVLNGNDSTLELQEFNFGLVIDQTYIFRGQFDAIVGLAYPEMAFQ